MSDPLYVGLMGLLLVAILFQSGLVIACVERGKVNTLYVIAGIVTLGLLVYLWVALLKPEQLG